MLYLINIYFLNFLYYIIYINIPSAFSIAAVYDSTAYGKSFDLKYSFPFYLCTSAESMFICLQNYIKI